MSLIKALSNFNIRTKYCINLQQKKCSPKLQLHYYYYLKNKNIMSNYPNHLKPPDRVAGLKILDKSLFDKSIAVPCLVVKYAKVSSVLQLVKNFLLKLENLKPVRNVSEHETHIYLNPEIVCKWSDLSLETRNSLNDLCLTEHHFQVKLYELKYDNFSLETVLRSVLPSDVEGMSSFTKVGHIVHVNLRDHLLPYKDLIGQVLYDKVPNCRTVVNKVANIDNAYRNFSMEILRGEDDLITVVKENTCTFQFDFSKVYWNSRLCTEHERIVKMIEAGSVVFDVFAGVGPFSIPLAKKKCHVFSNDLNPESYKWLNHNSKKNKVDSRYLQSFNKDGKEFILSEIKNLLPQYVNKHKIFILMNLPAVALDFLSFFVGLYENDFQNIESPLLVVVYCFAKGEDCNSIAKNLLFQKIGWDISDKIVDIFRVRTVSSLKEMIRIIFKLDHEILIKGSELKRKRDDDEIDSKKYHHGQKQTQQ